MVSATVRCSISLATNACTGAAEKKFPKEIQVGMLPGQGSG